APAYAGISPLSLHDALPILLARGAPGERVTAITGAIGLRANVAASSRLMLWSGMRSPLSVQVDPVTTLDVTGSVIEAGLAYGLRSEEHTSELQSRENLVCRL